MNEFDEYGLDINLDDLGLKGLLEKTNALRKRIPQGINDFQVDGYYEEEFFLEFEERGFDNDYFNQRIEQLPLFCDRGRLARNTRIRMEDKGMAGKITTQKAFIKANSDCKATTPHAMADRLAETDALLAEVAANIEALPERIARLIVAPLMQEINDLKEKIDDLEDSRKAMEMGTQENLGKAIERMGWGETGQAPSLQEGGEKKLSKKEQLALKKQQEQEETEALKKEKELSWEERKALAREESRKKALKLLDGDEALVDKLLDGLPELTDKVQLWEYVERVLCVEARVKYTTAYNDKLCEVYANNVGYSTTSGTIHNQLGTYLREGHRAGRF